MSGRTVLMEISLLEAAHLTDLVAQFTTLLDDTLDEDPRADPALARLVPDAYADDAEAADEYRRLTQDDLLDRRRADAAVVTTTLFRDGKPLRPESLDRVDAETAMVIELDDHSASAWLRTLAALRLVLATRLGIAIEEDNDRDDPRFGVYEWLGFRLEGLLQALEN
ncbi:DUF2017 family protein [Microbacterium sp.]|uniref:DUF2017 family protein n=1 Tax=Microbacterium sp. TaxID=51671 RepID=UPI003C771771